MTAPPDPQPPDTTPRLSAWRLAALIGASAAAAVLLALGYLQVTGAKLTFHFVMALSLGIGASVILAGALMALVFHSARSGHDAEVRDLMGDEERR